MRFSFCLGRTLLPAILATVFCPMLATAAGPEETGAGDSVMQLGIDGNIPGQVRMFNPSGNLAPIRAEVYFVQGGKVAVSASSDEWGRFQAVGLRPGVYSVMAVSREGFCAVSIAVDPYGARAATQRPIVSEVSLSVQIPPSLDLTLVPTAEFDLLAGMLAEAFAESVAGRPAAAGGFAGGGGGGGGGAGGLGALLGAAGLAGGITALATEDSDSSTQATPSTP
jgi:hypothetical protein